MDIYINYLLPTQQNRQNYVLSVQIPHSLKYVTNARACESGNDGRKMLSNDRPILFEVCLHLCAAYIRLGHPVMQQTKMRVVQCFWNIACIQDAVQKP